jgi:hypothetical protein
VVGLPAVEQRTNANVLLGLTLPILMDEEC